MEHGGAAISQPHFGIDLRLVLPVHSNGRVTDALAPPQAETKPVEDREWNANGCHTRQHGCPDKEGREATSGNVVIRDEVRRLLNTQQSSNSIQHVCLNWIHLQLYILPPPLTVSYVPVGTPHLLTVQQPSTQRIIYATRLAWSARSA
jgi:hypothetical protein